MKTKEKDMQPPSFIWVLWWKYYDGSVAGVERAYRDEKRATEDHELIGEDTSKEWFLTKLQQF